MRSRAVPLPHQATVDSVFFCKTLARVALASVRSPYAWQATLLRAAEISAIRCGQVRSVGSRAFAWGCCRHPSTSVETLAAAIATAAAIARSSNAVSCVLQGLGLGAFSAGARFVHQGLRLDGHSCEGLTLFFFSGAFPPMPRCFQTVLHWFFPSLFVSLSVDVCFVLSGGSRYGECTVCVRSGLRSGVVIRASPRSEDVEGGEGASSGDQVELAAALRGDAASAVGVLLDEADLLELLERVADDAARGAGKVLGGDLSLLVRAATKLAAELTNTDTGLQVHAASNSGCEKNRGERGGGGSGEKRGGGKGRKRRHSSIGKRKEN